MTDRTPALPHVDDHAIVIDRPRRQVWIALDQFVSKHLLGRSDTMVGRMLGVDPPGGFELVDTEAEHELVLAGRHRFSEYRLSFQLADTGNGQTRLTAVTNATFPGLRGRLYRLVVIGSRGHAIIARRMLRSIGRETR
jgi:hypothetical protein